MAKVVPPPALAPAMMGVRPRQRSTATCTTAPNSCGASEKNSPVPPAANGAEAPKGCSHSRRSVSGLGAKRKTQLAVEVGQREREQAGLPHAFEFLRGHGQGAEGRLAGSDRVVESSYDDARRKALRGTTGCWPGGHRGCARPGCREQSQGQGTGPAVWRDVGARLGVVPGGGWAKRSWAIRLCCVVRRLYCAVRHTAIDSD